MFKNPILFSFLTIFFLCSISCSDNDKSPNGEIIPENTDQGPGGGGGSDDTGSSSDSDSVEEGPVCTPLATLSSDESIVTVTPDQAGELQSIVQNANTGDVIMLEDGTYDLNGSYLWFSTPGVTLRSSSGDPSAVIIDGNYNTTEIVTVAASNVTIAEITLQHPYTHAIHVTSSDLGDTLNTMIYRVHILDPREQAIKINPHSPDQYYSDSGVVACSRMVLTDEGRPLVNPTATGCYTGGVDAHQAQDWIIRDNHIEGFWCPGGLSEHAIHLWRGCRDTLVERNVMINNARGVGFGLASSGDPRTFDDNPCPEAGSDYVGHYGGIIRNNFIFANSQELFNSNDGFDCGICLWSACKAKAVHNTIASTGDNFSSIEWRFSGAVGIEITNNIATHPLRERNEAQAVQDSNLIEASLDLFTDGDNGDLHLTSDATDAIDQGATLPAGICDEDIDGDTRDSSPDIGADEALFN